MRINMVTGDHLELGHLGALEVETST